MDFFTLEFIEVEEVMHLLPMLKQVTKLTELSFRQVESENEDINGLHKDI
jgi:hypothetical protein